MTLSILGGFPEKTSSNTKTVMISLDVVGVLVIIRKTTCIVRRLNHSRKHFIMLLFLISGMISIDYVQKFVSLLNRH